MKKTKFFRQLILSRHRWVPSKKLSSFGLAVWPTIANIRILDIQGYSENTRHTRIFIEYWTYKFIQRILDILGYSANTRHTGIFREYWTYRNIQIILDIQEYSENTGYTGILREYRTYSDI